MDVDKAFETLNMYREFVENKGIGSGALMEMIHVKSRDNARTPLQWDESKNAGSTTGTPWLTVDPHYQTINVKQALADPNSIFYYYQRLIRLRAKYSADHAAF